MANTGLHLTLGNGCPVEVSFSFDGAFINFQFYNQGQKAGEPGRLSRADAITEGRRVAETGIYEHCPVSVSLEAMKLFGRRLQQYGEELSQI